MNLRHIFLTLFMFPVCIFAAISGTYDIKGFDSAEYTGTLVITKVGQVYTTLWTFTGGGTSEGTGVKQGDSLAVGFTDTPGGATGVQLYQIKGDVLEGPWVYQGTTEKGFEKATKVHTHHSHSHHSH